MKLSASLVSIPAGPVAPLASAQKLASALQPGNAVQMVGGQWLRVMQKSASPDGLHFVVAGVGGTQSLTLRQFAALGPMTSAMRRLASFVHRAAGLSVDQEIKRAIEIAGLPVDPSMNWDKYLDTMYIPLCSAVTSDQDLIRSVIHDVVVDELYDKQILSPHSSVAHFDPNHASYGANKPLDKKVSAYLVYIFKHRKEDVLRTVKEALGVGMKGELGQQGTEGLDSLMPDDEDQGRADMGRLDLSAPNEYIEEAEGTEEVHEFLDAFKAYCAKQQHVSSARVLDFITDRFGAGETWKEIKPQIVGSPNFQNRSGKPLDVHGYNFVKSQWTTLLRRFALDPKEGWADTPISRMVVDITDRMEDEKASKKKPVTVSSLHLADASQELEQLQQAANNPAAGQQAPPPPPNPGVQPNTNVPRPGTPPVAQNLNLAQPAPAQQPAATAPLPQQPPQQAPRPTIPPEIPGVNHTASEDTMAIKTNTQPVAPRRAAAEKTQQKFARLQQIAASEPHEIDIAVQQLGDSFTHLGGQLQQLRANLGLTIERPSKQASVRDQVAFRNRYASELKRMAAENPADFAAALNDFYRRLNEVVTDFETLADQLGVALDEPVDASAEVSEAAFPAEEPIAAEDEHQHAPEALDPAV